MAQMQKGIPEARRLLTMEAEAVRALADRLDGAFAEAVAMVEACRGRVVVTGVGKSGHVGRKIAATLASTGTPAFFVHAGEALHGDLGMIRPEDLVIAIAHSGETPEVLQFREALRAIGSKVIALTGRPSSTLARSADLVLDTGVQEEGDTLNLAPTVSSTATLALGDALAVALMARRNFTRADFGRYHPGGALGKAVAASQQKGDG
jgi:arabinose-5-phosphate isomerase